MQRCRSVRLFRYGIEHDAALLRPDGTFADFTNTTFDELPAIVDVLPEDPTDLADLRVGDVGIKRKRWYIEGYERFDERGTLLRCDPKGLEIRTRIHPSIQAAAALRADQRRLVDATAARGWASPRSGSTRSAPSTSWSRRSTRGSGRTGWAHRRSGRPTCT